MSLHDHRAAGRERRGGVAARNRESQREIARPEHCDGADADVTQAQIGPRQRLAVREREIKAWLVGATGPYPRRKQAKLIRGAGPLACEAGGWQTGFLTRT